MWEWYVSGWHLLPTHSDALFAFLICLAHITTVRTTIMNTMK